MMINGSDDNADRELAPQLRALHGLPSTTDVAGLRRRVLNAAAGPLAARARRTMRESMRVMRPTWLDVTSGFSRIAIPLSLAAAVLAMVVVRQLPVAAEVDDTTLAFAYDTVDGADSSSVLDMLRLPEDADAVLLAPSSK